MYHRVLTNEEFMQSFSNPGIIVNRDTFEKQIKYLTNNFKVLSISQVIDTVDNKHSFTDLSCLITFDDGWYDNYKNALPILQKHDAASLIFLPINYIGTNKLFWQEQLANYIYLICQNEKQAPKLLSKYSLSQVFNRRGDVLRHDIYEFVGALKRLSNREIDEVVNEFKSYIDNSGYTADNNVDKYINWDQALEMSHNNVSFGSHAMSHRLLTKLAQKELNSELKQSKEIIEKNLQKPVLSIAYPNGNYNNEVTLSAKEADYKVAFTTESGYFAANEDAYTVKRINMHQAGTANIPLFLCRILQIF